MSKEKKRRSCWEKKRIRRRIEKRRMLFEKKNNADFKRRLKMERKLAKPVTDTLRSTHRHAASNTSGYSIFPACRRVELKERNPSVRACPPVLEIHAVRASRRSCTALSCFGGALLTRRATDAGASRRRPVRILFIHLSSLAHLQRCAYSDLCGRKVNARRLLITRYIRPGTRPSELLQHHHIIEIHSLKNWKWTSEGYRGFIGQVSSTW
ncbi:hypothetical protein Zmor_025163 [Zophobas morio]|uniref:Uncharacterized protein n=1 Tax=Zophobas morio TaxID=2755281 RepID=A0AA38M3K9_9CUCU|nr:hypothetical protein Zmor_025163 [Zophobas morio]